MVTTISNLTCEYQKNPLGIDLNRPRLSWQMNSMNRGAHQKFYQIHLASSEALLADDHNLLWDSGKIEGDQSTHVVYRGPALKTGQRVYWKVKIWDELGNVAVSEPAWWEMGLLDNNWQADWITPGYEDDSNQSQAEPLLRRKFQTQKEISSARIYVTCLGLYELHINGQRVGDAVLTPGWTSYEHHLQYQTYDVTHMICKGENAIGVLMGDGWYRGYLGYNGRRNLYGNTLALLLELHLTYTDGCEEIICSDESWRAIQGPILMSDIYMGETYDARKEKPGWDTACYDDNNWFGIRKLDHRKEIVTAQIGPYIRRHENLRPIQILNSPKGETILDFGQNMVGWVQMRVRGPKGTTITLKHAELLDQQGNIYTENLRLAKQTTHYTLKGQLDADEIFEPHFTFQGFRYVAVEGFPGEPSIDSFTGVVVHSDTPLTGTFECSHPLINQLQKNIVWSQKGNFVDVPTDCPQRDERLGWTGDTQVYIRTACFNMNAPNFYKKWLVDLSSDQKKGSVPHVVPNVIAKIGLGELGDEGGSGAAGWGDAAVICPWTIFLCYGDTRLLEEQYKSMVDWVQYVLSRTDEDYIWRKDFQFGDWLDYRGQDDRLPNPVTNYELVGTAFFAYSTQLLANIAKILGKTSDAEQYNEMASKIKTAFNGEFVTPAGRVGSNTQTAYVLALYFDLLEESIRPLAASRLVEEVRKSQYHITTGFLGTPYLCHVLSRFGYTDIAYKLLNQEDFPSWLYPVKQGATTIWERWDGIKPDGTLQDPGMNSFNHYAYGAIGDWLYRVVAGIEVDPNAPGYKRIIIHPQPGGGLTFAKAGLDSFYGRIESMWMRENDGFQLNVAIPANTEGVIYLPGKSIEEITETGKYLRDVIGIRKVQQKDDVVVITVGSGNYQFCSSFCMDQTNG